MRRRKDFRPWRCRRLNLELVHKVAQFGDAEAHEMRADFARVNDAELCPLFELGFTNEQELARSVHVQVASEVIDPNRLSLHRIGDGADKNLVWDFEAEHEPTSQPIRSPATGCVSSRADRTSAIRATQPRLEISRRRNA